MDSLFIKVKPHFSAVVFVMKFPDAPESNMVCTSFPCTCALKMNNIELVGLLSLAVTLSKSASSLDQSILPSTDILDSRPSALGKFFRKCK